MTKTILFFICILITGKLSAAIFTVISNSDSGPGTLREAIILANANGTVTTDYIYFDLSGSTSSDVTVSLASELPQISSNVVIDATSQPVSALNNPNIKISLIRIAKEYFNGLKLINSKNIEIYGLSFNNFKADPLGSLDEKKAGIFISGSSDIIIGSPGKPNCFNNCYAGILAPYTIPRSDIEQIKISSNIFGLSEDGVVDMPNETGMDLSFLKNSVIGGNTIAEGNLIASNIRNGIAIGGGDGLVTISNNIIGLDKNLTLKASASANGIYVNGNGCTPVITENIIAGQLKGIWVDYVNGGFTISRNWIGTGFNGTENYANGTGIHINFSSTKSMIGGSSDQEKNFIAYNKVAIIIENSYPISILRNSIYCNEDGAITFRNQKSDPAKISVITANEISGVYKPSALVELFYLDECAGCQGKTWFATLSTDHSGAWKYVGTIDNKVTSLGTDENGATSDFSKPEIDVTNVQKNNVFCSETTGSISGLNVYNASVFRWYNSAGILVGQGKSLEYVGAGTYYLKAGQFSACDVQSIPFTISVSASSIDDSKKVIKDAKCGQSNGSIRNIGVANNLQKTWYTSSGTKVSIGDDLLDVSSGSYYFKAGTGACEVTSDIYTVADESRNYLVSSYGIIKASCGNNNGGIQIKTYQADVPLFFTWLNEDGNEISNLENLGNVSPGIYRLIASDGEGCSNEAGRFMVTEAILPVIDLTKMQTFTSCDGKTISVTGIHIVGSTQPFRYQWADGNGNILAEELMLKQIVPGIYRLMVTDTYGCEVRSDLINFNNQKKEVLTVPNSFTPNGDGFNDIWQIEGIENYPNAEFVILNRTGNQLFYSKGYTKAFDGTFKGKPLPVGVYYYLIDLKNDCGRLSGSLTLIK
ncbi:gliding motility-associated C-terminal domain-containing protein [Pedobacter frigidisoli]|uniref:gliding motility-associated C-terminal domain-containing protein n=1 Tax=Pedobacter frigidisoli TaxID=2530455 RepID=UPI00292EDBB8|nr:gliding motility-associated C-terminal domain-containing protein [Pedobacter frigidisoli]